MDIAIEREILNKTGIPLCGKKKQKTKQEVSKRQKMQQRHRERIKSRRENNCQLAMNGTMLYL